MFDVCIPVGFIDKIWKSNEHRHGVFSSAWVL